MKTGLALFQFCKNHGLDRMYFLEVVQSFSQAEKLANFPDWQDRFAQLQQETGISLQDLREHYNLLEPVAV